MPIPAFLTEERSLYRLSFALCGLIFFALCVLHIARQNLGLASFLGAAALLCWCAAVLLSERQLQVLATMLILANIAGATFALLSGTKVQ